MASHDVVLLTSGQREVAERFGRFFQAFGDSYQLHTIGDLDGIKAYLQAQENRTPDLLLLDLTLPRANAFEVLDWTRQQARFNALPVIVTAAPNELQQISRGYQMGANAFLTKPPAFGELRDVLLALEEPETAEAGEPENGYEEAPMVLVKSQFVALGEAIEQAGISRPITALEDIETAKAHLHKQAGTGELPVFVDLGLGQRAIELIEWAKADARIARTPIVVLCTPGDIRALSRAADAGADLFLVKPVTPAKLAQIRQWLPESWSRMELQPRPLPSAKGPALENEALQQQDANETPDIATINLAASEVLYVAGNSTDRHMFSTAMAQGSAAFKLELLEAFADVVEYVRHKGESRRITSAGPGCLLLDSATIGEASSEILRWIRNQSSFPEVVVVMLSNLDDPETVQAMYRAGADYYLVKPKSFAGLLSIVSIIDAGLRQVPEEFAEFERLPEYRDRFGNPPNPDPASMQCAE
jgi:DNA-binding response OmpR family regulator